jgi:hypothetical protein
VDFFSNTPYRRVLKVFVGIFRTLAMRAEACSQFDMLFAGVPAPQRVP